MCAAIKVQYCVVLCSFISSCFSVCLQFAVPAKANHKCLLTTVLCSTCDDEVCICDMESL